MQYESEEFCLQKKYSDYLVYWQTSTMILIVMREMSIHIKKNTHKHIEEQE